MRIIFAGTPEFAASHLRALIESEHDVVAVYTQPDRPAGRGKKLQASAVKLLALENGLRIEQPESLKTQDAQHTLQAYQADIMIVVAYGLILPKAVLDIPKFGCVNVHGSLLPKWRGAAPIQRAVWAGDSKTGVTIMQMDEGLDTGPSVYMQDMPIEPTDTSASVYEKMAIIGPQALIYALSKWHELPAQPQDDSQATYAKKLSKEEAKVDWRLSARQLERNSRAFFPWPGMWFEHFDTRVKIISCHISNATHADAEPGTIIASDKAGLIVATGDQSLCISELQLAGKKPMTIQDVLNARQGWFDTGIRLQ